MTGLYYHDARWRSGERFLSFDSFEADPASPASLHKYLYANANPVYYVDPTGSFSLTDINIANGLQQFLQGIRATNAYRAWKVVDTVMDAVDMVRMFADVISLFQSGGLSAIFHQLRQQAAGMVLGTLAPNYCQRARRTDPPASAES